MPSLREVVVILDGVDRYHAARSLDLLDARLGEADMFDLACVAVVGQQGEALLERDL